MVQSSAASTSRGNGSESGYESQGGRSNGYGSGDSRSLAERERAELAAAEEASRRQLAADEEARKLAAQQVGAWLSFWVKGVFAYYMSLGRWSDRDFT